MRYFRGWDVKSTFKPAKYPEIFAKSQAVLINKIDFLEVGGLVDFDIERAIADTRKVNKDIKIFPISAKTGKGVEDWYLWLAESLKKLSKDWLLAIKIVGFDIVGDLRGKHIAEVVAGC